MFKRKTMLFKNLIPVARTRWPWLHKNFSGYPGWKGDFVKDLEAKLPEIKGSLKILGKIFGRIIMLDKGKSEFWKYPKVRITNSYFEAGWLYWAISLLRGNTYYISQEIKKSYEILSDEETLQAVMIYNLKNGNSEYVLPAMDILLQLGWKGFILETRVVAKNGDRIEAKFTYPAKSCVIMSVNGMTNHVLAAKYHKILTGGEAIHEQYLMNKEDMPPRLRAWVEEPEE